MAGSAGLIAAGLLMGLAGSPHCVGMCGVACATWLRTADGVRTWPQAVAFQVARALSYAAGGALAAGSLGLLKTWGDQVVALRPFWTLAQGLALVLGLWLLVRGGMPRIGAARLGTVQPQVIRGVGARRTPLGRALAAGAVWVAWPCGLLHSALLVASIAPTPPEGAAVMLAFAVGSAGGLLLGGWLVPAAGPQAADRRARLMTRLSGGLLLLSAAWSLLNSVQSATGFC
jgi:sulfite exporter TauE/SafE